MNYLKNKFIGSMSRILCKCYEFIILIYTFFKRGFERDPSQIILDYFTEDQEILQQRLDRPETTGVVANGELLVIIPFRDNWKLTEACLESLDRQIISDSLKMKVILIDNASIELETKRNLQNVKNDFPELDIQCLRADYPFNFSKLNNDGYKRHRSSETKFVLFLNNDVEIRDNKLINIMAGYLQSFNSVGVLGGTLVYPDEKIQHLFAAPGFKIVAAHPLKGVSYQKSWAWFKKSIRPVAAVTGALMMMRSEDFEAIGMFDEQLPTLGQDVVACLIVRDKLGKCAAAITAPCAVHHESWTKPANFPADELSLVYSKYGAQLRSKALVNAAFSRWSEKPLLALPGERDYPVASVSRFWQ
jgi:GT2 family glycosyltransferase